MKDVYVQVLLDALQAGTTPEQVLNGLKKTLEQRGHSRLHGAILKAALRQLTATRSERVVLRVAEASDVDTYKAAIEAALAAENCTIEPKVILDETLIGGYQLETGEHRIDASYKQSLTNLYRNITK